MKHARDIILISSLAVTFGVAALIIGLTANKGDVSADIYVKDTIVESLDLSREYNERTFTIDGYPNIVFGVKHNAIAIVECDCPNESCVHQGYVSSTNTPIICAHYGICVKLNSSANPVDVVAG